MSGNHARRVKILEKLEQVGSIIKGVSWISRQDISKMFSPLSMAFFFSRRLKLLRDRDKTNKILEYKIEAVIFFYF